MIIPSAKELAALMTDQRKKLNLTQAEVADRVGLKQKTISAFENKPEGTKIETLFQILSALNLDLNLTPKKNNVTKTQWRQEW